MNATRRKAITKLMEQLTDIAAELESLGYEEQEAFENLPESLQNTEAGERLSENADNLTTANEDVQSVVQLLEEICY